MLQKPEQYLGPDRRGWRVDKTLSVGHLLTTIVIAGSALVWALRMEGRIVAIEEAVKTQGVTNRQHETSLRDLTTAVREDLRALNGKVDRLIERQQGSR